MKRKREIAGQTIGIRADSMRVEEIISDRSVRVNAESRSGGYTRSVIAQVAGGGVAPVLQLKFTGLLYPLIACTLPLSTADCPANIVAELLAAENSKSGA